MRHERPFAQTCPADPVLQGSAVCGRGHHLVGHGPQACIGRHRQVKVLDLGGVDLSEMPRKAPTAAEIQDLTAYIQSLDTRAGGGRPPEPVK